MNDSHIDTATENICRILQEILTVLQVQVFDKVQDAAQAQKCCEELQQLLAHEKEDIRHELIAAQSMLQQALESHSMKMESIVKAVHSIAEPERNPHDILEDVKRVRDSALGASRGLALDIEKFKQIGSGHLHSFFRKTEKIMSRYL